MQPPISVTKPKASASVAINVHRLSNGRMSEQAFMRGEPQQGFDAF